MKHTALVLLGCLLMGPSSMGADPSAEEILNAIDRNLRAANRVFVSQMVVHGRRASRTISSKSWVKGDEKSFTEYLSPAREKGVKMLKLEDQLWTYTPNTDRTIRISGHMLRQSVMGSDLSYEDMMEDNTLSEIYTAEIEGETELNGRNCWVLKLSAKVKDIAYHSRKIVVDKERFIPLKEERFGKSGKLLKTTEVKEMMRVNDRWVAKHIVFKDALKEGDGTEFFLDSVEFDVDIPEYRFSKASLRK